MFATVLQNLGLLYVLQGRYAEAEPLYTQAVATYERTLGDKHPYFATALGNLAQLYGTQGRHSEAEALLKQVIEIKKQALGPDHPEVAMCMDNLGGHCEKQGRFAESESLRRRALEMKRKALGPDHPSVGTTLNNLGLLYLSQEKYTEAESLLKQALEIKREALGPNHPDVATPLNCLGGLYKELGNNAEAESLYRQALAIREKVLGPDHPDVATVLNNLAVLHYSQGEYAEAEPLYQRALTIFEKALGPDHPSTVTTLKDYTALLREIGKEEEAVSLEARAQSIRTNRIPQVPSPTEGGTVLHPSVAETPEEANVTPEAMEHYERGWEFVLNEQYQDATGEFLLAIQANPDPFFDAEQALATTYRVAGAASGDAEMFDRAIEQYQRVVSLDPTDVGSLCWLGFLADVISSEWQARAEARSQEYLAGGRYGTLTNIFEISAQSKLAGQKKKHQAIATRAFAQARQQFPLLNPQKDPGRKLLHALGAAVPVAEFYSEAGPSELSKAAEWYRMAASMRVDLFQGLSEEDMDEARELVATARRRLPLVEGQIGRAEQEAQRKRKRTMTAVAITVAIVVVIILATCVCCWGGVTLLGQ